MGSRIRKIFDWSEDERNRLLSAIERKMGAEAENIHVVGSYAQPSAEIREDSDIDIVIGTKDARLWPINTKRVFRVSDKSFWIEMPWGQLRVSLHFRPPQKENIIGEKYQLSYFDLIDGKFHHGPDDEKFRKNRKKWKRY